MMFQKICRVLQLGPRTAQAASRCWLFSEKSKGDSAALVKMILSHPNLGQLLHVHGEHTRGEVAKQLITKRLPV